MTYLVSILFLTLTDFVYFVQALLIACSNEVLYITFVVAFQPVDFERVLDYKIGICCSSAKHTALRRKRKEWLARNQDNVSEWSDMSIRRLLFQ